MKPNQSFHEFYTKFLHLSGRAQIAESELKFELNNKLSFELQRSVISQFHSNLTLREFAEHCGVIDQSLKIIAERQNRVRRNAGQSNTTKPTESVADKLAVQTSQNPTTHTTTMTAADHQKFLNAGLCFYCKEAGHRANRNASSGIMDLERR
jgi:hypothetical protein